MSFIFMPTLNVKWKFRRKSLFRNKTLWLTWRAREHACRFRDELAAPSNVIDSLVFFFAISWCYSRSSFFCRVLTYVYACLIIVGLNKNNVYVKNYSGIIVYFFYLGVMTSLAVPKTDFIFPWNLFSEISRITPLSREINSRVGCLRYFFARDTLYNSEIDFNAGCAPCNGDIGGVH